MGEIPLRPIGYGGRGSGRRCISGKSGLVDDHRNEHPNYGGWDCSLSRESPSDRASPLRGHRRIAELSTSPHPRHRCVGFETGMNDRTIKGEENEFAASPPQISSTGIDMSIWLLGIEADAYCAA